MSKLGNDGAPPAVYMFHVPIAPCTASLAVPALLPPIPTVSVPGTMPSASLPLIATGTTENDFTPLAVLVYSTTDQLWRMYMSVAFLTAIASTSVLPANVFHVA